MIELAHSSLLPGGPGASLLILSGALFVAAVYLFAKKGPPRTILLLVLVALAIGIGAVAVPPDAHDARLAIERPLDGATVPAREEIDVVVSLSGATLEPSSGHLRVLVDDEVVSMTATLVTKVRLAPGPHTIEAELVSPGHRPLSPRVLARADVTATTSS
jgi:hypothetical protein